MSDDLTPTAAGENEPFDQTNGLAQGLEGDDRGTIGEAPDDGEETGGVLGKAFRGLAEPFDGDRDRDPDADRDRDAGGPTPEDEDEAVTPYSEEGR
ncbi:hypothetical protein ITJ64_05900 [Herbiconiux sp. VKM Ac-1786]|uniref:hypothetical protein n=1 Tax=Herbiconiux sp. VKM Ac-1786 TaxID=2783824 RepID=UPI00188CABC8|nr:hypothetical protein [Herbiconiux sp. VKM Ac-1786]MBF4572044.1 hypothetical protein [Herbiconiux sp. VKM Ac-1786]